MLWPRNSDLLYQWIKVQLDQVQFKKKKKILLSFTITPDFSISNVREILSSRSSGIVDKIYIIIHYWNDI